MLSVYLGGISGDTEYQYHVNKGLLQVLLYGDQLVNPWFDSIDIFCSGCASEPTECIS